MMTSLELCLAFGLDAVMGDPRTLPHPVRAIGGSIAWAERLLYGRIHPRVGGIVLAASMVALFTAIAYIIAHAIRAIPAGWGTYAAAAAYVSYIYLASTTLAMRGLVDSVRSVFSASEPGEARRRLSMIVGRDTASLDEDGVRRAALESLAENASDGIIAPLFYLALGGLPLAVAYKTVNTLDSMVGYKNDRYREFGWASARLDDLANYAPARITGLLICAAELLRSGFRPSSSMRAFAVMLRDGRKHASPNSGIPEAAMAGALGIRLGGPSTYGGISVQKPFINSGGGVSHEAGRRGVEIAVMASVLGAVLAASALYLVRVA